MKIGAFHLDRLFEGLRSRRPRLGIAIEEGSARIVRLERRRIGGWRIGGYGEVDVGILHADEAERQRVRLMVKKVGGGLARVAVSMEHPSLRIRRMNLARMPERDLIEAIRWNFREYIEGPVERYSVGFVPIEERVEEGRVSLLAYGMSSEAIEECTRAMKGLGLKTVSLEPTVSALHAALHANGVLDDDRYPVCLYVGDAASVFSVMRGPRLLFTRPLAGVSLEGLVRLVMRNLALEEAEARRAVAGWLAGVKVAEDRAHRVELTAGHFFSQFVVEAQRSIDAFCIMYDVDRVDALHVCGRGAFFPGLVEHAHTSLGVETSVFNPFAHLVDEGQATDEMERAAPLYAAAVGLAMP